ncbi:MAG TPA: FAD-dependent monooxygenase [Pseudolabrys sp.]|nr:FAD-dependent monooxygenase [Pseudolabrys sp.]
MQRIAKRKSSFLHDLTHGNHQAPQQNTMTNHFQVAIVGGGPVGLALAISLGSRGIACALIESRVEMHRIPKGQNLTHRTLEHFYFWGIADELRATRLMPRGYPIGEITAYGDLMSAYWHAPAGRELVRPYYFQDNERLPQYQMEAVLRRKLAGLSCVQTFFGFTATAVAQDDTGVRVEIEKTGGGGRLSLSADYLVGCDGARSLVRTQAGIERHGTDFDRLMVLTVFRSRALHELLQRFPERSTYRVMHPDLHGYWQFFGRIDVGEGFFFHAPVARDTARADFEFRSPLYRAVGAEFDLAFDYTGFWELRNAVADSYQAGRVFIAGDAAHSHPPYGGFGLNNGLEDAVNLGWKLAARLQGWGGENLLHSYTDERGPVFRDIAEDFIAARIREEDDFLTRFHPERDRAEFERAWETRKSDLGARVRAYEPNYEGSPIVFGPAGGASGAHGKHVLTARTGHHLSPQPLASGKDVYEHLGAGFTLIALDTAAQSVAPIKAAARARGIPLTIVADSAQAAREAYGCRLILVRPDQFIAWAGEAIPSDPAKLLDKVSGY